MDLEKIISKFNIPNTANIAIHVCKIKNGKILKEYKYHFNQKDNVLSRKKWANFDGKAVLLTYLTLKVCRRYP